MKIPIILLLMVGLCFASIELIEPISKNVDNGDIIYLGVMGPGQTIGVSLNPEVKEGGKYETGGFFDYIEVANIPEDWKSSDSKLYANPSQIEITAGKDILEGNYSSTIIIFDEDNSDGLGNITLYLIIEIKHDVVDLDVSPKTIEVGANQPAIFTIKIKNKGMVQDKFEISSTGMQDWNFKKRIYVPANSEKDVLYEVVGSEEETYEISITAKSESSDIITKSKNVNMKVNTNLISDYKATNNGLLIFPIVEAPIYFLMGLISNFF